MQQNSYSNIGSLSSIVKLFILWQSSSPKIACDNNMYLNQIQHQTKTVSLAAFAAGTYFHERWNNDKTSRKTSFCETSSSDSPTVKESNHTKSKETSESSSPPTPTRSKPGPKLLFLGSGSSTGCPKPICSLLFPPLLGGKHHTNDSSTTLNMLRNEVRDKCQVSKIASIGNPLYNKNYRNNPSLLISHANHLLADGDLDKSEPDHDEYKNVIIDVGKTFRETAIRWMPLHSIYNIDAVVLTHEHADAILGLDDLRGFQLRPQMFKSSQNAIRSSTMSSMIHSLPIYLSDQCFQTVKRQFGYLVPKHQRDNDDDNGHVKKATNGDDAKDNKPVVKRLVASLDFQIIHHFQPFNAGGLMLIPLPVIHGEDLICNGYAFSIHHRDDKRSKTNVVYLSDISRMIPETEKFILEKLPPTDILIVDSLNMKGTHPVHFSLEQALETVKRLNPKQTYIVGINCDDFPEHDEANELIKTMHPNVELAYDGLVIEL